MARFACLNIDLDALRHYAGIHALPSDAAQAAGDALVYGVAVRRLRELCAEAGVKATLFAVGSDLEQADPSELKRAVEDGHEIGNHTYGHDYALTRRAAEDVAEDIRRGAEAIERVLGVHARGFRAPGYTLSPAMYEALCVQGYAYDSSVFPALPYYAGKAALLAYKLLRGTPSRSIMDRPRVLTAPLLPYCPDPAEPYRKGHGAAWELPLTVEPVTRFPFIGTYVLTLPEQAVSLMYRRLRPRAFLNLELHAVDLLDRSDGISERLARAQRDLRVSASKKIGRLRVLLAQIQRDYEVMTLLQASQHLPR